MWFLNWLRKIFVLIIWYLIRIGFDKELKINILYSYNILLFCRNNMRESIILKLKVLFVI